VAVAVVASTLESRQEPEVTAAEVTVALEAQELEKMGPRTLGVEEAGVAIAIVPTPVKPVALRAATEARVWLCSDTA
jgi:hypothetical protein